MTKKNNLKKDEKVISETEPEGAKEIEQVEEVEEVEEEKPKKKKEVTEAQRAHLATIRVKALKVKAEKKLLREKAKELEKAELELKAQRYDNAVIEKEKLKTPPKEEEKEEEVIEEVKPKKVKKVIKKIVEQSESEEEEIVEQVIIKKKSNNNNKPLTNNEKVQLAEQSAEERLRQSLKEDRLNYLLNQIGAKL